VVCVVEEPTNIATIEKTRSYNGVYHVLHGTLSPIGGVGPEQLRIASLFARLTDGQRTSAATIDDIEPAILSAGAHLDPIALNEEVLEPDVAVREVILATSPTTEGEATAAYLAQEIRRLTPAVRITRIATGVPAGSDIEYADEVTMTRALEGRRDF
jgi:recombination protein RecR